ncbi:cilia- and flagella-associated protein 20-like [Trichogramma pretiosum]|uniref:cilia- and flagella-associated protein 20-like n=1 Tax=Trichogramma pretiosum TaxID=7493 RepID=UPI0006C99AC6|nr:cilia- and flagella-associated protein 20-like [Trichogramma pretiosum]
MYRSIQQRGFLPVLQAFGQSPLSIWGSKVESGCIRRVTDEQVRALALEIAGTNVSTTYVYCPKNPRASLGIYMPYLVMVIKGLKRYFTFEVTVLDDRNVHRRFRISNFQRSRRVDHFCTSMPLSMQPGWNEISFDLASFVRKAYKTNYVETTRIKINANCRIRVIYFCDKVYDEKDIPQKYKIFMPLDHVVRKKGIEAKRSEAALKAESRLFFEDEEEEEMMYVEVGSMPEDSTSKHKDQIATDGQAAQASSRVFADDDNFENEDDDDRVTVWTEAKDDLKSAVDGSVNEKTQDALSQNQEAKAEPAAEQ